MSGPTMYEIVGGPWPERIGAMAYIVEPDAKRKRLYPFPGLGKNEVVVFIVNDPLGNRHADQLWSCVIDRAHLRAERL